MHSLGIPGDVGGYRSPVNGAIVGVDQLRVPSSISGSGTGEHGIRYGSI